MYFLQEDRCHESGCGTTLVLDGNMKNHRDVCAAKETRHMNRQHFLFFISNSVVAMVWELVSIVWERVTFDP